MSDNYGQEMSKAMEEQRELESDLDMWKARAEAAEAKVRGLEADNASISDHADDVEKSNMEQGKIICDLQSERVEAIERAREQDAVKSQLEQQIGTLRAACAAKDAALSLSRNCCGCSECRIRWKAALSPDAGRDYVPREELNKVQLDLARVQAERDEWKAACNWHMDAEDACRAVIDEKEGTLDGDKCATARKVQQIRNRLACVQARIRELEAFLRSTFDDEDITPTSLEFWSSEYKHAMRQLADAGKKDQRIRDLEYERNERVLRAELARVQAEAAAMRKVLESPVQIGYGLLCRYMCHACCRAWSPGDQQTHEDDCVLARTTAGRDLLERLERAEALANKQTP